tara:strand:- start:64 stop:486 length:423 start_codon:yes stop_codon:yes gene_type:complete
MIRLKLLLFTVFIGIIIPCGMSSERSMFIDTVEAFNFLSKHHHELHIMIGEDEGDFKKAYNSFYKYISATSNDRLLPIKNGFFRIKDFKTASKDVKDFDALVDYYQSGLSLEIEGILKGYGYSNIIEMDKVVDIYDKIKK